MNCIKIDSFMNPFLSGNGFFELVGKESAIPYNKEVDLEQFRISVVKQMVRKNFAGRGPLLKGLSERLGCYFWEVQLHEG